MMERPVPNSILELVLALAPLACTVALGVWMGVKKRPFTLRQWPAFAIGALPMLLYACRFRPRAGFHWPSVGRGEWLHPFWWYVLLFALYALCFVLALRRGEKAHKR